VGGRGHRRAAVILVALVVGLGDAALVLVSWRSRSVLPGVLGISGVAAIAFAVARSLSRGGSAYAIVIAGLALVIGLVLYGLGQAFERILDDDPDDADGPTGWQNRPHKNGVGPT
jgi:hypothetical protein